ncbi:pentatricopeptide repeat-containing protein At2g21090 [Selaginella moellendorffii]|nr:pentatricopeptide repeat-containing protein At2g21090 [Selaginella moellendorffii]|eukprot:XP_002984440.2 pentatricopeptide repeat-containing protein At2g21090 [Selaginella moellendorffii]
MRRILRSLSTVPNGAGCDPHLSLSRYVEVLTKREFEDRAERQAASESRRLSRRSIYRDQDGPRSSGTSVEVNQELKKELDRLEELQQQQRLGRTERDEIKTYETLLRQCTATKALEGGKRLHHLLLETRLIESVFLANLLIQMYGTCGQHQEALAVFQGLKSPNVFSWNIIISAYTQNGHLQEARELFSRMPKKNVVTWNTMIAAFVHSGQSQEALDLFDEMGEELNKITLIHALQACESLGALEKAQEIHSRIIKLGWESHTILSTALFNVFAKHGSMLQARAIFEKMPHRDVVCWNSMVAGYARRGHIEEAMKLFLSMTVRNASSWNSIITAYVQSGHSKEAFGLFKAMDLEGVEATKITFLAVLGACTGTNSLAHGKLVHTLMVDAGFAVDITAATALITMYANCGAPEASKAVFLQISHHNCITWASLVAAYAHNGRGKAAVDFFRLMCLEAFKPNQIAFVNVLHACSHGGLLECGTSFFQSMVSDYGLEPIFEHYVCMVDVLGRSGRTDIAENLILEMPFEPDGLPWTVLLAACKIHHDVKRGARAAEKIVELDPKRCVAYTLLANAYSGSGNKLLK